ncbi:MAG: hypothetical protein ED559_00905 [Phycisphaera sp.]|nr:MAG: hypothetical protein ED559_00905 [Phycisphaera sp.]
MRLNNTTLTPTTIETRFNESGFPTLSNITLGEGTKEAYHSLARLHYRTKSPATLERIICATCQRSGELAGVLVTSRPTLNAAWRSIAWPGVFDQGTKPDRAKRINEELRTISRVIIDQRFRGLGIAKRLVRSYIDRPDTRYTEAVAAMGAISPFLERAGMRAVIIPEHHRDRRLRDLLEEHAKAPIDLLTSPGLRSSLETQLRHWARASASTRRLTDGPIEGIARDAAARLIAPIHAYTHETH